VRVRLRPKEMMSDGLNLAVEDISNLNEPVTIFEELRFFMPPGSGCVHV
jgi:hypothetical protein